MTTAPRKKRRTDVPVEQSDADPSESTSTSTLSSQEAHAALCIAVENLHSEMAKSSWPALRASELQYPTRNTQAIHRNPGHSNIRTRESEEEQIVNKMQHEFDLAMSIIAGNDRGVPQAAWQVAVQHVLNIACAMWASANGGSPEDFENIRWPSQVFKHIKICAVVLVVPFLNHGTVNNVLGSIDELHAFASRSRFASVLDPVRIAIENQWPSDFIGRSIKHPYEENQRLLRYCNIALAFAEVHCSKISGAILLEGLLCFDSAKSLSNNTPGGNCSWHTAARRVFTCWLTNAKSGSRERSGTRQDDRRKASHYATHCLAEHRIVANPGRDINEFLTHWKNHDAAESKSDDATSGQVLALPAMNTVQDEHRIIDEIGVLRTVFRLGNRGVEDGPALVNAFDNDDATDGESSSDDA